MFAKASRISLLLTMLVLPLFAGAATGDKGSVSGTVKDAAGAVLQGAQVVLQPTATSVASDAQGNFVIPNIAPGTYTVTVSYVGFDNSVATIVVTSGQTAT
jgi:iron complex outermembrane receptor protein